MEDGLIFGFEYLESFNLFSSHELTSTLSIPTAFYLLPRIPIPVGVGPA